MADVHCRFCGEPTEIEFFYEAEDIDGRLMSFKEASAKFIKYGCGFQEEEKCTYSMVDKNRAIEAEALQALSEHPDDWFGLQW